MRSRSGGGRAMGRLRLFRGEGKMLTGDREDVSPMDMPGTGTLLWDKPER